jgi:hypothetical protein
MERSEILAGAAADEASPHIASLVRATIFVAILRDAMLRMAPQDED